MCEVLWTLLALIARVTQRTELNAYCELHSCLAEASVLRAKSNLKGIILSGGPFSVYEEGAPHLKPEVWEFIAEAKLPVLGICYGFQEMTTHFGGKVEGAPEREFGHAELIRPVPDAPVENDLFAGVHHEMKVRQLTG